MKSYNRFIAGTVLLSVILFIAMNAYFSSLSGDESGREYRVEINRLQKEIEQNGVKSIEPEHDSCIKNITLLEKTAVIKNNKEVQAFFEGNGSDYVIRYINGNYYRFDYRINYTKEYRKILVAVNIGMAVMAAAVLAVLIYMRARLVKPFHRIKEVPYELSKGNLTVGLKENRNRFFGRFVWGLDLLREHLEEDKVKELTLQKEKKTLVLSISHDIKTPLSAIKLYSKALIRNLYDNEEKRIEIAERIGIMADEIEKFVSEIIKASSEDFLKLQVNNSEFYLKDLLQKINLFYSEKLSLIKIDFTVENYSNCLIKGDLDRAVEVLQNMIENAVKYGDGKFIRISVSEEEDYHLVTVANSGCTLKEDELQYVFDSFWRGSNAGSRSGNGLGLYICRQLMRKMDGDIYAQCINAEMRVTAVFRMI